MQFGVEQAPDGDGVRSEQLAAHVAACEACGEMARKLRALESAVRSLPVPVGATEARLRFEARMQSRSMTVLARGVAGRIVRSRWAAAAVLALAVGGSVWGYQVRESRHAVASAETLDSVVAWDLNLAQTDSPDQRRKLMVEGADAVKQEVSRAGLDAEDRRDADDLIRDGVTLADGTDPLAQADHFSAVADLLANKMDRAARKSPKALDQLGQTYFTVVDKGIHRNLDRARASGVDSPERQKRLERILQRNLVLERKIEAILSNDQGNGAHPHLRKALELHKKRQAGRKGQESQFH